MGEKPKREVLSISPAEIKKTPNTLILYFKNTILPEGNFEIHATRLRELNSGRVQGEISILRMNGNQNIHAILVPQAFDFSSSSYKENLEREMRNRLPEVDWTQLIDETCYHSITHIRAGEPEYQIDTAKIISQRPAFILYPFLAKNQPNIIFGKKGSCKSTFGLLLALCVASGWYDNPWFVLGSQNKIPVLWLDWETDREGFEYDLKRLSEGNGKSTEYIFYQHCRGSLINLTEKLNEKIQKYEIGLVVVDSIAPASGGEIKEAVAAIGFHDALRYFGKTSLSIGHPTKAENQNPSVTGAGQFEDLARNIWEVVYDQEEESSTGHQALIHRKPYKTGLLKPLGLSYEFGEDPAREIIIVNKEDPKLMPKAISKMGLKIQIKEYLKTGAKTHKEIVEDIGIKGQQLSSRLNELKREGTIIKLDSGKWGLTYYQTN